MVFYFSIDCITLYNLRILPEEVMRMADEKELLDAISETADMGCESLRQVLGKIEDDGLKHALQTQLVEYEKHYSAASKMLEAYGKDTPSASPIAKINSRITIDVKTLLAENPTSKIAEMVMQGSTMGVTKVTKALHAYNGNNEELKTLAERLIKTEEANIEEMKKFL